jgi:hypothetical protein
MYAEAKGWEVQTVYDLEGVSEPRTHGVVAGVGQQPTMASMAPSMV